MTRPVKFGRFWHTRPAFRHARKHEQIRAERSLNAVKIRLNAAAQRVVLSGQDLTHALPLEMVPHELAGVQLRRITGQEMEIFERRSHEDEQMAAGHGNGSSRSPRHGT
jgi:hypothetical protein